MGAPDYSLYLVTDRALARGRPTVEIVREAVAGGVTCVQLREKNCGTREFVEEARALLAVLRPMGVPLIVNDRVDVARTVGADGVHLGQQDLALADRSLGLPALAYLQLSLVVQAINLLVVHVRKLRAQQIM